MNHETQISEEEIRRNEEVEKYLKNQMSDQETEAFRKRIEEEPELAAQVKNVQLLTVGIAEAALTEKLNEYHKGIPTAKIKKMSVQSIRYRWLAAASVILILVAVWFSGMFTSRDQRLYSEYYVPDSGLVTAMGESDNYTFDLGMVDYKSEKYQLAITKWEALLKEKPESDTLQYFLASARLAKGDIQKAISDFEKVLTHPNSVFLSDTYWYLGLALLQQGKTDEAVKWIEKADHEGKQPLLKKMKN